MKLTVAKIFKNKLKKVRLKCYLVSHTMFSARKLVRSTLDDFEIIKIYMSATSSSEGEVFPLLVYGKICYKIKVALKEFLASVTWIQYNITDLGVA